MSSGNFQKAFLKNFTIFITLKRNKIILHHFQGSREEEDGLIESKKPKGKTYNRNNINQEE